MTDSEPDFRTLFEGSEDTPRPQRGDVLSGRVVALDTPTELKQAGGSLEDVFMRLTTEEAEAVA